MGRIHRMNPHLANLIAAGEVVERPVNIVKELVENAIDAAATSIQIDLLESGLQEIRVRDNGHGMDEEDLLLAFERHATSKITTEYDLFHIRSLGFRGEALPSIASVSSVDARSSMDDVSGTQILLDFGTLKQKKSLAQPRGTQITITKLFYHTPARLKYIKSVQYELALIADFCDKVALSYPQIRFQLTNNGKSLLQTPGNGQLLETIAKVYGNDVAKNMVFFEKRNRDYTLSGYRCHPQYAKSNRQAITTLVNGRVIRHYKIQQAVLEGYGQLIPEGRYPICVLAIHTDPSFIDVNIHPSKLEIKFSEESMLIHLIKEALQATFTNQVFPTRIEPSNSRFESKYQTQINEYSPKESPYTQETFSFQEVHQTSQSLFDDLHYIGQYAGTYLLFQKDTGLFLLDQHAAAERIRYELYSKRMASKRADSMELTVPLEFSFTTEEWNRFDYQKGELQAYGFDIEASGPRSFSLRAIPAWFPHGYEALYSQQFIDFILQGTPIQEEKIVDELAILLACKHSLKANQYLSNDEVHQLINQLKACVNPSTCPHGRPILVEISHYQIEKWFKRTGV